MDNQPEIPDQEFDKLMKRLEPIEEENPELKTGTFPTQRVGGECLTRFKKVRHKVPMLSLQNCYREPSNKKKEIR